MDEKGFAIRVIGKSKRILARLRGLKRRKEKQSKMAHVSGSLC
jgi:hypothetical protein